MTRFSLVLALSSVLIAACGSDGGGDGDTSSSDTGGDPGGTSGDPGGTSGDPGSTSGDPGSTSGDPGSTSGSGGGDPTGSGSGGAGSGGGTGSGGAPPSGACTNAADNAILTSTDVEGIVEQCATEHFGAEPATKECIADSTGLSDPCVTCFDNTIQCTVMNCIGECFSGMTPECTACMDANCTPAFESCSGLTQ